MGAVTEAARVQVRRAVLDDAPEIARVHVASWQGAYRGLMPQALIASQTLARRCEAWQRNLSAQGHDTFVAVAAGGVVGFISIIELARDLDAAPGTAELVTLYVEPGSWGIGAGAALMHAGVQAARARGSAALTLWVLDSNARARAFYERHGFCADGQTKKLRWDGPLELGELRYRLPLRDPPSE